MTTPKPGPPPPPPRPQPPRPQPARPAGGEGRGRPPAEPGQPDETRPIPAAGPLGKVLISDGTGIRPAAGYRLPGSEFRAGPSALIMMHRVAFFNDGNGKLDDAGQRGLLKWAAEYGLGQEPGMVRAAAARRALAVRQLRAQGHHVVRLLATPEWRLAAGLGNNANPHEIGLSLHGTYGWPVIPGSSLKGLAAAWASAVVAGPGTLPGIGPADIRRVFGTPRQRPAAPPDPDGLAEGGGRPDRRRDAGGTVCFLDAIPAGSPVTVSVDVLTPHVKPYYETTRGGSERPADPPAEYHNPVPVNFLAVSGAFAVDLYGRVRADVDLAAKLLSSAADELGAGGKTAAGYGFLSVTGSPDEGR